MKCFEDTLDVVEAEEVVVEEAVAEELVDVVAVADVDVIVADEEVDVVCVMEEDVDVVPVMVVEDVVIEDDVEVVTVASCCEAIIVQNQPKAAQPLVSFGHAAFRECIFTCKPNRHNQTNKPVRKPNTLEVISTVVSEQCERRPDLPCALLFSETRSERRWKRKLM